MALLFGLAGVGYRLVLMLLTVPGTNSDEATFGLAALHIAQGREFPVYMYGQHYMGVLESYLAAPLFALFGPSWVLLRLPLLLLFAAFLYLMYRLTRELYSPWLATVTVGLLALGSERVVRDQMTAAGGRPETKPALVLLVLIAIALAQRRVRRRWLAYTAFGLLAGATLWSDWLAVPYLAAAAAVLLAGVGRRLLGAPGLLVLGAFVVGAAPLLWDSLTAPPGKDAISVFRQLETIGGDRPTTAAEHLDGGVLQGVPLATGLCPPTGCARWQMAWGALYVPLLLVAAAMALAGLVRARRTAGVGDAAGAAPTGRPARPWIRHVATLALAAAAVASVVSYARSPASAVTPLASARYLTDLQISLPVALWPLWRATRWARPAAAVRAPARVVGAAALGVLAAVIAAMLVGTTTLVARVGSIRAEEQRASAMAAALREAGVRHVYGEYWTCNRLTFTTREQVVCAVLGQTLRPGQDRYDPYPRRVRAADRPGFVFARDGAADRAFAARLRGRGITARVTEVGDYRIYRPDVTVHPWR
ncbi:hypothetical protein SAMN05444365_104124 [Micromonospora pattaloongensis]|uniref:4-amino-4-deoxy-L-arabinose transferase n=1 Tax=Micromonospora pattaloongensis TaxID=405436 RepID=A0A1H3NT16_9ACTN|nr:hypothetical protein SAMN05444365_104124 [Micromonospora pattaloongensis]